MSAPALQNPLTQAARVSPVVATSVSVRPVVTKRELEVFLRIPWSLGFDKHPLWVPPMMDDARRMFHPRNSPFLKHGELQGFVAYEQGQPVGRISVQLDREFDRVHPNDNDLAFFGFFAAPDREDIARALFDSAETWARSKGRSRLRGPYTLDSKGECGVLIEGFDTPARVGTPYNDPYFGPLIEAVGYAKVKDLYSWWYTPSTVEPLTLKMAERTRAYPNVKVRPMNLKDARREAEIVQEIFNEAWSGLWGFVPFTAEELELLATEYKLFMDPEIALVAEVDGEPAGICFAVPDVNELLKGMNGELKRNPLNLIRFLWRNKFDPPKHGRLILLGLKKKYRASRRYGAIAALLYTEVAQRGQKRGYLGGELGQTLEDNHLINQGIERMGARRYKTHRVYEKSL